ncbi:hypothetical protein RND71_042268 [Anisodus tanguticus]|uniref:Uncharacterized protein n=1 Tax=Anisodus tanguticus TaxID=243964 RepID=A0AAE1US38_9SOLA|nr:hypothetical protein RND71_042268 [Anisodus tanguticus]
MAQTGQRPGRAQIYLATHKNQDGEYVNKAAKEKCVAKNSFCLENHALYFFVRFAKYFVSQNQFASQNLVTFWPAHFVEFLPPYLVGYVACLRISRITKNFIVCRKYSRQDTNGRFECNS